MLNNEDHAAFYAIQRADRKVRNDPRYKAAKATFRAAGEAPAAWPAFRDAIRDVRAEVYAQHGIAP